VVMKWYYAHGARTEGPFSTAELRERAEAGLLHPDDPLWPVPPPPPPPAPALPDWLDDVRAADQPVYPPAPPVSAPLPDWLADVRQAEGEGSHPATAPPPSKDAEEVAAEVLLSEPPDGGEPQRGSAPPKAPPAAGGTGPVPLASPVSGPVAGGPGQPAPPRPQAPPARPTEPFDAAFRRAMKEVHHWVEQEENHPLVLRGSLDAIGRDAGFQELLQRYQGYGPEMAHKLWQYLHFLIENRR
jgi:hypothetical protein